MAASDVQAIITQNKSYSNDMFLQAQQALNDLRAFVLRPSSVPSTFPEVPETWVTEKYEAIRNRIDSDKPAVSNVFSDANLIGTGVSDMVVAGVDPQAPEAGAFTVPAAPTFSGTAPTAPTLASVAKPTANLPGEPGAAPDFNMPAAPDRPTYSLPTAPSFTAVAIPVFSGLTLPTFSATAPIDNITAPTNSFSYAEAIYESAIQDELKAKILDDLQNGGYGIEDADELRIWDRARERDTAALGAAMDEIARASAARGFTMPPGTYYATTMAAASEAAMKTSSMSRDIASKRADLYVENRKFMIETGVSFEKLLIDFFTSKAERALNVAKLTVQLGIETFNAQVAKYNMLLESYKTQANVYEVQIRAELAKLEEYKGRLEGARITSDIQRIEVDKYRVQVEAVTSLMNLYRVDVDVMKTKAEIENLKLSGYRSRVEAYAAGVQAYSARFQAYEAEIRGETAKAQMYEAQVRGYTGSIDAEKTKVDAQRSVLDAQIAEKNAQLAVFKTEVDWWTAKAKTKIEQFNAAVGMFGGSIQNYSARIQGEKAAVDASMTTGKINCELMQEAVRMRTQQLIAETELLIKSVQLNESAAVSAASTITSSLNAYNTAVSGVATISA